MADGLDEEFRELLEAMTKAGEVLNDAGVPWALGGVWGAKTVFRAVIVVLRTPQGALTIAATLFPE